MSLRNGIRVLIAVTFLAVVMCLPAASGGLTAPSDDSVRSAGSEDRVALRNFIRGSGARAA